MKAYDFLIQEDKKGKPVARTGYQQVGVSKAVWEDALESRKTAGEKKEKEDYTVAEVNGKKIAMMFEKGTKRLPKVAMTEDWLEYVNQRDFGRKASKMTGVL